MSAEAKTLQQEWYSVASSGDADAVIAFLDKLEGPFPTAHLLTTHGDLLRAIFARLQELTTRDRIDRVWPALGRLLPYCLGLGHDHGPEARFHASTLRERLRDWLDQYPPGVRRRLRGRALDAIFLLPDRGPYDQEHRRSRNRLSASIHQWVWGLGTQEPQAACWTVAAIGFRRYDLVPALRTIAKYYSHDLGAVALSAISSLGVPSTDRVPLLDDLHDRVNSGQFSRPLLGALQRLSDPGSIAVIARHWLGPEAWTDALGQGFSALQTLSAIADAAPEDGARQEAVWDVIAARLADGPEEVKWNLHIGSIATKCDSDRVVPTLLALFLPSQEDSEQAAHRRYLLALRLAECVRPHQLEGWDTADAPRALAHLRRDAQADTKSDVIFQTAEMLHKEAAWEALLLWGRATDPQVFPQTITGESNPFVRARMLGQLACFRLGPLPAFIATLVKESFDQPEQGPHGELLARMAAIRVTASAATPEAFAALRRFGLTSQGEVLQDTVDALSEVAAVLAKDDDTVLDNLVGDVTGAPTPYQRRAAAGAIEPLAAAGFLRPHHAKTLADAILDEGRNEFERGRLLAALAYLPTDEMPSAIAERLVGWAAREDELGDHALDLLARRGQLDQFPELFAKRLGLRQSGYAWGRALEVPPLEQAAAAIGLLYERDPGRFLPAVVDILASDDYVAVLQIGVALGRAHTGRDHPPVPAAIRDALLTRLRGGSASLFSETALPATTAKLIPEAFASEPWGTVWDGWLAELRAALADALGGLSANESQEAAAVPEETRLLSPQAHDDAIGSLLALTKDAHYGVRRAAYRALARRAPTSLQALYAAWSVSHDVALRQRAAEAYGWRSDTGEGPHAGDPAVLQQLAEDPEPYVRDSIAQATRGRMEREWASKALDRVLGIALGQEEDVRPGWRYGQATIRWGDDTCLARLRRVLATGDLAPHARQWLNSIAQDLENRWRKTTRDWPDPWFPWEGALSEVDGAVIVPGAERVAARLTLWRRAEPGRSGKQAWGGTAVVSASTPFRSFLEEATIVLADGRACRVFVEQTGDTAITFRGADAYPQ